MGFQAEKEKMRQKICIDSAKEIVKKSRNQISSKPLKA